MGEQAYDPRLGPAPLPECDYCGEDFLIPSRGYKHGCPKHDPAIQRAHRRESLEKHYAIARAVIRRSKGDDVQTALVGLDHLYAMAGENL